ncbi:MAG: Helix-turn-helix domain protein [Candidatus Parvarchaeum acidophilus ARMAN-5_'5-way FS']|jgi:uncharacterized protein (TIGR00270 family)|uniref:Helix-turn-helix domain protein n=2 Tax=Parvarchaeum acidophilus TaxID=662761 RepID=D6GWP0_PARA5|nr:MAG: helix-turn-helix domain protein [Candidatus Parvarchaeum acidophilus ARMAN-5]EGD71924.1 MAG: Helix-turn-helix domain protein [Candidatus Parvarchaeum acidophilus ARMAN-5_'5-way FS']
MNCEICGAFEDTLTNVEIEGASMNVCTKCSKYGKYSGKAETISINTKSTSLYDNELKENFADIIKEELSKSGLSVEEISSNIKCSPNDIRKIIKGKMLPDLDTSRKLERFFRVSLYDVNTKKDVKLISKDTDLSFGDVVEIKKKR